LALSAAVLLFNSLPGGRILRILERMCEFDAHTLQALWRNRQMANPVVHFEIVGGDKTQLQSFYGSLFDWKIDANNPMDYGMVEAAGGGIAGGVSGAGNGDGPRVTVYARVDDLQASLDKAQQLGGKVLLGVTAVPGGPTIAMIADPAGNPMGMIQG
jgi:predicted enzyme related to lactoylglutathione lyase